MLNNEQKLNQQAIQIFNIAEKPVMEYIAEFLEESPIVVFKDEISKESDPLILLPINEYKEKTYLKFTLKTINRNGDDFAEKSSKRISDINNIIMYDNVKESVGFLLYCIKSVYPSILASSMINNKPMVHVDLELNERDWVFYPKFNHELSIKKKFLEDSLTRILYMKEQKESFPKEMTSELDTEFQKIILMLEQVKNDLTPEILETEKNINMLYENKPVIGIFVDEITKTQLPKKKYNNDQLKLQSVSGQSYEDPH